MVQASGRPDLRLIGVLATRVRKLRFAEHEFRMRELRDSFGDLVLAPIPDRIGHPAGPRCLHAGAALAKFQRSTGRRGVRFPARSRARHDTGRPVTVR